LRERNSDIPLLIHHFLKKFQEGNVAVGIDPEVLEHLRAYPWPGNVRELANVIQQMMVFCKGDSMTMNDIPPHVFQREKAPQESKKGNVPLMKMVSDMEKKWILTKLKETGWNQEKTARLLGITRKMLTNRIAKYHFQMPKEKGPKG